MKLRNTLVIFFAASMLIFFTTSFLNGPANRGHDKTGSPISSGQCMNCHSSGSFSPSLQVAMFEGDTEVSSYEPGKSYTLKYQLVNSGSPAAFGFQTVALTANDEIAGSFSNIPEGFRKITLKEVDYVEHSSPRPISNFEVDWTAPADGVEAITIYTGAVAANSNSNTGGDGADVDELVLQPNTSGITDAALSLAADLFHIKGNVVRDQLIIQPLSDYQSIKLNIFTMGGEMLYSRESVETQFSDLQIQVSDLPQGMYFIQFASAGQNQTKRFMKY